MGDERDVKRSFYERYGTTITPVLLTALFSIVGVHISSTYQANTSATQLISEREKAESELRASMFKDLIGPIIGDPKKIPPERERLLVELLALNFGEHFELKPLMQQVDRKIANSVASASAGIDRERLNKERHSLQSIARRVSARQIAMLLNQGTPGDKTSILPLAFIEWGDEETPSLRDNQEQIRQRYLNTNQVGTIGQGETIRLCSPDHNYTALIALNKCDWLNQTCTIHINLIGRECLPGQANASEEPAHTAKSVATDPAADLEFESGWFDFPLTDNTLLSDGNRFAIVMQEFDPEFHTVAINFVWFPKAYFAPRERPINYADIRKKLKIEPNK